MSRGGTLVPPGRYELMGWPIEDRDGVAVVLKKRGADRLRDERIGNTKATFCKGKPND